MESLLGAYRVLDLTDEKGFFCGRIMGDLGADVIKIENLGGEPGRNIGPFYGDIPDPEKSLYWFAYNANKKGITLNIETSKGRDIFRKLVRTADVVIESFYPGYMDGLELGYSDLCKVNPAIVMTSITAFGQTGPFRDFKASDLTLVAMGGPMAISGNPDRSPVRISFPQAYLLAGAQAAAGTMIALYYRGVSGEGQWVDVSIEESQVPTNASALVHWDMNKTSVQRSGHFRAVGLRGAVLQRQIWHCKGGFVCYLVYGGIFGANSNRSLTDWIASEGMANDFLKSLDWDAYDMALVTQEESDQLERVLGNFFLAHTKRELYEEAVKRGIMLFPVCNIADVAESPQLRARNFWVEVEHPELRTTVTYPGAFVKLSETPCRLERRAPLIGEHNEEIYVGEMGLSENEFAALKQGGVI